MKKILVPMIFWSVFYVLWQSYFVTNSGFVFKDLISILFSPSYFHLWFLYTLIGVYLFTPVLRKLIKVSDNRIVLYYIGLWFMAASLVPFIEKLTGLDSRYDFSSYSGFIGYFIMGLYLGMKNYEKKHLVLAMIVIVICLIISVVGTYYLTASREGVFTGYFYGYLSPNVILSSAASFVLIKHYFGKSSALISTKFYSVIKSINDCSFGIYLVHVIFIYLLKIGYFGFELSVFTGSPILAIPMTAITVLLMSYLTVRIIRNIPYLRHVTP